MGKQQEILPEIIQLVDKRRASIGLILGGSIALGEERPDSDLDLFAIAESPAPPKLTRFKFISEKNGCTLSERKTRTFPIHFACWTDTSLDDLLDTRPYVAYPLLKGRIVLDRDGIARRYRQRIQAYFARHPVLTEAWEHQLLDFRRAKKSGQIEDLKYLQWGDFVAYLEEAFHEEITRAHSN